MGGGSFVHTYAYDGGYSRINYYPTIRLLGVGVASSGSFAKSIRVNGVNYESLRTNPNRFKFCCSFRGGLSSEDGNKFINNLVTRCINSGVSLQLKTEDHNYDGLNVYTWHFELLILIMDGLYVEHKELFKPVPRIFIMNYSLHLRDYHVQHHEERLSYH